MLCNIISLQIKDKIWKAVWRDLWEHGQWICDDGFFQKYPKYLADLGTLWGIWGISSSHRPIFGWDVSYIQRVHFCRKVEFVAIDTDKNSFFNDHTYKTDIGQHFHKSALSQNSWYFFQMQITPLLWRPQGPQGCLEKWNYPLSSNLEVWCAKIGPKIQKLQKTVEKPSFFVVFLDISEVFWIF